MVIPVANPKLMLANKGYDGDDARGSLLIKVILPMIRPRANHKEPVACNFHVYKDRYRIERMIDKLKQFRRITIRYDKTALSFLSFLNITASCIWMKGYFKRT